MFSSLRAGSIAAMLFNRSAPHARVVPVLTVSDVRAVAAWYERIFGFVEHVKIGDGHRAQLGLPGGAAAERIVAEVRPGPAAADDRSLAADPAEGRGCRRNPRAGAVLATAARFAPLPVPTTPTPESPGRRDDAAWRCPFGHGVRPFPEVLDLLRQRAPRGLRGRESGPRARASRAPRTRSRFGIRASEPVLRRHPPPTRGSRRAPA